MHACEKSSANLGPVLIEQRLENHLNLPVILCSRIRATAAGKRTFSFNIYSEEKLGLLFSVKTTFVSIFSNKDLPKLLSGASFV